MAVHGVVPVAAMVPVLLAGASIPALYGDHYMYVRTGLAIDAVNGMTSSNARRRSDRQADRHKYHYFRNTIISKVRTPLGTG